MLICKIKSQNYPNSLNRLHNPPDKVFIECLNWQELLERPKLAIVGSRRPSPYGQAVTMQIAKEVASRGVVIISGLALGTDSYAHKAALSVGGLTIAVLPAGINNIYPSSHNNLANQIVDKNGALVSTYEPDEKIAFKGNFVARNRIIAALADAILIPEAAEKSGSLHTAKFALDIGIDVMAVPGQITNPYARGSNNLIKAGALMVTNISDVLEVLGINKQQNKTYSAANETEEIILKTIQQGITDGEEIFKISGLGINGFNQTMTLLEINGQIKPGGGNTWFLT